MDILGVIMAGGSGSRLWPLSRANHPKQFLALDSNDTMLQATAKRLECLQIENTVTICNEILLRPLRWLLFAHRQMFCYWFLPQIM
jgi:mannose-1-phosphate guanylyltransferase